MQRLADSSLFSETVPKLWDMSNETAAALMQQWTGFEPTVSNAVVVRCAFIARRSSPQDRWGVAPASPQEIPACYFTRDFSQFRSYLGGGQWREEPTSPGPPWRHTTPPLNAMAVLNREGRGIALFSPAATQPWNYGPHGPAEPAQPDGGPCVHLAALDVVPMGPRSIYRYRFWLVVGTVDELAAGLDVLRARYATERAEFLAEADSTDLLP